MPEGLRDRLELKVVNWMSVDGAEDFDALPVDGFRLADAARIFDSPETANFINLSAMEASLELVRGVGVPAVTGHCTALLDRAAEGLQARGHILTNADRLRHPSPLLCFRCGSDDATERTYADLKNRHIEVSLRHDRIRVSPYLYNNAEDIDRLLETAG